MISREFYDRACYRNEQNELFFGGTEGLDVFNPDSLILETKRPVVNLTDFKLFNKMADNKREANYTNLAPGDYTFRVKAKYDKGNWSEDETSIHILIIPAWWMRTWVKILFLFVIVTVIAGSVSMRIRGLRIQQSKLEFLVAERTNEIVEKNDLLKEQTLILTKKNDQLKDLNSTKDKLFSIISHDLRSPFNTILGFEELLINNYHEFSDDERKNMINQLHKTSNQTYDLVENILNWARIQTRNIKYEPNKFNLKEFFTRKFDLYEKIAENKGISLLNMLDENLNVYTDVNFLETILRNLINNAIKFTPSGGTVQITADSGQNEIIISVNDSGIGMTKDQIETLFHIEKNKSTGGTNGEKGSGLGLILCKEFIEEYKGTITVKSDPDKGSTFSFTVPATSAAG